MRIFISLICFFSTWMSFAQPSEAELSVWANEAIVSTYTFDYQNFLEQQKKIAHYFDSSAWLTYSGELTASKLQETIEKNKFKAAAVAQSAPELKTLAPGKWQAIMPLLVVYTNNNTEQKQTLLVTIVFKEITPPSGVRGLAIESYQSKIETPSCSCNR